MYAVAIWRPLYVPFACMYAVAIWRLLNVPFVLCSDVRARLATFCWLAPYADKILDVNTSKSKSEINLFTINLIHTYIHKYIRTCMHTYTPVVRVSFESALGQFPRAQNSKKGGANLRPHKNGGQKPPALQIVLCFFSSPLLPWPCLREDG